MPRALLLAGRHGQHPALVDGELTRDAALEEGLRLGAVRPGEPVLVPVTGAAGVIGVLAIAGATRVIDELTAEFESFCRANGEAAADLLLGERRGCPAPRPVGADRHGRQGSGGARFGAAPGRWPRPRHARPDVTFFAA